LDPLGTAATYMPIVPAPVDYDDGEFGGMIGRGNLPQFVFASGQHVGFAVDKAALGQVFSEYFGFPCQSFHQFLHHHNHPGLAQ
jgi:hypothetical protein